MDILETKTATLKVEQLVPNEGQLESMGVHANPRTISDDDYRALVESMKKDNMTGVMPLKVFEHEGTFVVLGGNMRLRALKELGLQEVACIVVPKDTDAETLNKIIITDNSTFGDWDMDALANWNEPLDEWGCGHAYIRRAGNESGRARKGDKAQRIRGGGRECFFIWANRRNDRVLTVVTRTSRAAA